MKKGRKLIGGSEGRKDTERKKVERKEEAPLRLCW